METVDNSEGSVNKMGMNGAESSAAVIPPGMSDVIAPQSTDGGTVPGPAGEAKPSSDAEGTASCAPIDTALGSLEAAWYGSPTAKDNKAHSHSQLSSSKLGSGQIKEDSTADCAASDGSESSRRSTLDSRGRPQIFKVVVHRAKSLKPRDSNSVIDAMVSVRLAGKRVYSRVAFATTNPIWEQELFVPLPEKVTQGSEVLRITIRDYNKAAMQPRLVGLMEYSFLDLYQQMEGTEGLLHQWHPLNKIANGAQVETGQLLLSMSVINQLQIPTRLVVIGSGAGNTIALSTDSEDLDDWALRVTMHEAVTTADSRTADPDPGAKLEDNKYSMTLRFGQYTHTTTYNLPQELTKNSDQFFVAWQESFDIPLKQIATRPKIDGKIQNRLMQFGNSMGMDGLFYDSREDAKATDEMRFIFGRVPADQAASGRPTKTLREQAEIRGTCQYPLSGIDVLKSDVAMKEAMDKVLRDLNEHAEKGEDDQGGGGAGGDPSPGAKNTHSVLQGLSKFFGGMKGGGAAAAAAGGPESPLHEGVEAGVKQEDVGQRAQMTLDLRGGTIIGQFIVSFKLVKTSEVDDERASVCSLDDTVDFNSWLAGEPPIDEEEYGEDSEGSNMQMLPPLKDALFADEEVDLPLDQLFYQLVSMDSAFFSAKKREQNIRQLEVKNWELGVDGAVAKQKLSYVIQLPVTKLGPSEAYTEAETIVQTLSPSGFVVQGVISTPKIVFGDVFSTVMQTAAVPCGPNKSRLQTSFHVVFRKPSMFQGVIRSGAIDGGRIICGKEIELLKSVVQNGCRDPDSAAAPPSLSRTLTRSLTIGAVIEDVQKVDKRTWYFSAFGALAAALAGLYMYREKAAFEVASLLVRLALAISPAVLQGAPGPSS